MWSFPLFPEQASTVAESVDIVYVVLLALAAFFSIGIATFVVYFTIRYRHTRDVDRSNPAIDNIKLEVTWIIVPLMLSLGVFTWAAAVYFDMKRPPPDGALEVYVSAKQWMWKFQHAAGPREINTLHVPVDRPIKMIMTSQDVIHSFFVPAFRIKQDVLPGRYTNTWFEATRPGTYQLFCAEYCGTEHSMMRGEVVVMEPEEYEHWLSEGDRGAPDTEPGTGRFERSPSDETEPPFTPGPWRAPLPDQENAPPQPSATADVAEAGAALFEELRCNTCHRISSDALYPAQGPVLEGVFGRMVRLQSQREVAADEQYLRESILYPQAKLVLGYPPIMPTYQGQISEEEMIQVVAYLKTL